MGWCFWIDRGGTFTDLIGRDPEGQLHVRKVLSEQAGAGDPAVSAMEAMLASASLPVDLGDVDDVRLGTTVATNALLEGAGAPLLLLTNAGLIQQERRGRVKWCKLDPDAMQAAWAWMQGFGQFDALDLDGLEAYIEKTLQDS